jgi:pyruvate/2-oxoglutarate dehydrogenase complex dihydrolipoamide acyltransferase (E2) component
MSIALAEQLKKEWTDKYVVVDGGAPELKRFSGLTGTVKTINMNGRALVEFDGAVDIGWYDIDPSFLKVVSEPLKKKAPEKHEKPAPAAAAPKAAAAAAPAGEKKLSPLELARQQGAAAKAGGDAAKKPSPLDLARQQGAAKAEAAAPAAAPTVESAPAPAAARPAAAGGSAREKPGSTAEIIELCRKQGAFKG